MVGWRRRKAYRGRVLLSVVYATALHAPAVRRGSGSGGDGALRGHIRQALRRRTRIDDKTLRRKLFLHRLPRDRRLGASFPSSGRPNAHEQRARRREGRRVHGRRIQPGGEQLADQEIALEAGWQIEVHRQEAAGLPHHGGFDESDFGHEHPHAVPDLTRQGAVFVGHDGGAGERYVFGPASGQGTAGGEHPDRLIEHEAFFAAAYRGLQRHHADQEQHDDIDRAPEGDDRTQPGLSDDTPFRQRVDDQARNGQQDQGGRGPEYGAVIIRRLGAGALGS